MFYVALNRLVFSNGTYSLLWDPNHINFSFNPVNKFTFGKPHKVHRDWQTCGYRDHSIGRTWAYLLNWSDKICVLPQNEQKTQYCVPHCCLRKQTFHIRNTVSNFKPPWFLTCVKKVVFSRNTTVVSRSNLGTSLKTLINAYFQSLNPRYNPNNAPNAL